MIRTVDLRVQPPPLETLENGTIRVRGTRVPLEAVLYCFKEGRTAEEIRGEFPTLLLGDVYTILAYYLWNREELDDYLAERERAVEEWKERIEQRWPRDGLREELEARRRRRGRADAPAPG